MSEIQRMIFEHKLYAEYCVGHTYTQKLSIVYVAFKCNWHLVVNLATLCICLDLPLVETVNKLFSSSVSCFTKKFFSILHPGLEELKPYGWLFSYLLCGETIFHALGFFTSV